MADFPALPLWTDAYLADTRHLSQSAHGAYLLLLMEAWRRPRCCLPDDDSLLARLSGSPNLDAWLALKPTVMAFWKLDARASEWTQKRMLKERDFVEKSRRQKRDAARKRWQTTEKQDAAASSPHVQPTPTPTPTKKEEESSSSNDAVVAFPSRDTELAKTFISEFWTAYPRKKGKAAARAKFIAKAKGCGVQAIMAGLARAKAEWSRKGTEIEFIPHPATWLNQGRWEDEPDAKSADLRPRKMNMMDLRPGEKLYDYLSSSN